MSYLELSYEVFTERPKKIGDQPWVLAKTSRIMKVNKPAKNHPWRRSFNIKSIAEQKTKVGHFYLGLTTFLYWVDVEIVFVIL